MTDDLEQEIAALAARYGAPRRERVRLADGSFDPLTKTDRFGEVCMVIRRPGGSLLTAIKTFYPPGAHRLLTGGIGHGETIEAALLRETAEETGLEVAVRRFLAVIEYEATDGRSFATFAFLLDELGGALASHDPSERLEEFREVSPAALPEIAARLEAVPDSYDPEINGRWRAWGAFRAVVHRVVYAALGDTEIGRHEDWKAER